MDKKLLTSLNLFVVLSRAHRAVNDCSELDIRASKLNPTEFAVLELLYHKGPHPLQQIGERILLASGSITYVVDKLEKKGLLARNPCPNDRRITHAAITEAGIRLMDEIFPKHAEAIHESFSGLDEQEKELAIKLLKKMGLAARAMYEEKTKQG